MISFLEKIAFFLKIQNINFQGKTDIYEVFDVAEYDFTIIFYNFKKLIQYGPLKLQKFEFFVDTNILNCFVGCKMQKKI